MKTFKFLSQNKKTIIVISAIAVFYFGYKYVAKKIKAKRDRNSQLQSDINALNNQSAYAHTEDMSKQGSNNIWDSIYTGLF